MQLTHDYASFFPFSSIRDEQRTAIEFVLNAFLNNGKKFCILELPTGVGKSAIAITVARYLNNVRMLSKAYVLTTQKVLQEQYLDDFGPMSRDMLRSIKSSANYRCLHYTDQSCAESKRVLNALAHTLLGTEFYECCRNRCPYTIDKEHFLLSNIGVTNFSYFLSETMYAGHLKPRDLLVIDEAHNIEGELSRHIEVSLSERFAIDVLKGKGPKDDEQRTVFEWIRGPYKASVIKKITSVERMISKRLKTHGNNPVGMSDVTKQYELLDKHVCKVNRFIDEYQEKNWVLNVVAAYDERRRKSYRRFEFKPIDVSTFSEGALFRFGEFVLMMSATILDKNIFCKTIGLDVNDVAFMSMPSPFKSENRRVCYAPVGSMSKANIDETLPKLALAIKMIIDEHANEKGIVHAQTYKIAKYIKDHLDSERLLIHNPEDRIQALNAHVMSDRPTVLLSPSMTEGVDLADDSSRFQILCKVPYPYLGDNVIKKRMELDPRWYDFQTAKMVVQALGRSVRNANDHAVSYILDADWERFYRKNRSMFPDDFSSLLV